MNPLPLPGPYLGADVIDNRYPQRVDGPGKAQVEPGIVYENHAVGPFPAHALHRIQKQAAQRQCLAQHFDKTHDRLAREVVVQFHAGLLHAAAAKAGAAYAGGGLP